MPETPQNGADDRTRVSPEKPELKPEAVMAQIGRQTVAVLRRVHRGEVTLEEVGRLLNKDVLELMATLVVERKK